MSHALKPLILKHSDLDKFVWGDINLFINNERPFRKHFRLKIDDLFKMKYLPITMVPLSFDKMWYVSVPVRILFTISDAFIFLPWMSRGMQIISVMKWM